MSASEKLKALLQDAETAERGWDNDLHGEPLLAALPQIVAVMEAAERAVRWKSVTSSISLEDARSLYAALNDLDEALS